MEVIVVGSLLTHIIVENANVQIPNSKARLQRPPLNHQPNVMILNLPTCVKTGNLSEYVTKIGLKVVVQKLAVVVILPFLVIQFQENQDLMRAKTLVLMQHPKTCACNGIVKKIGQTTNVHKLVIIVRQLPMNFQFDLDPPAVSMTHLRDAELQNLLGMDFVMMTITMRHVHGMEVIAAAMMLKLITALNASVQIHVLTKNQPVYVKTGDPKIYATRIGLMKNVVTHVMFVSVVHFLFEVALIVKIKPPVASAKIGNPKAYVLQMRLNSSVQKLVEIVIDKCKIHT